MSLKIDSGLFKFDFTDHHAILGISVDAEIKDIRRRYLKIVRRLHPDSCPAESQSEKDWASQILSKLVNPAYEKLSQQRSLDEYVVLLSQMGKRLTQEPTTVVESQPALALLQTSNVEQIYKTSLNKLAEKQYDSINRVLPTIAQISELNLVYLRQRAITEIQSHQAIKKSGQANDSSSPSKSFVEQYFRRAQDLIAESDFNRAGVELQEALKLEPNNSRCHSLMGSLYLRQNLLTMAKVYFERALTLNPQDKVALAGIKQLEQTNGGKTIAPSKSSDKSSSSGVFGGLFKRKNK